MPIVPTQATANPETSIITLAAYARHIQACECGFFGVVNGPECVYSSGCRAVWTKEQRDWAQYYLAEAQYEIEKQARYFIGRRWVVDEEHNYENPVLTNYGYVHSGGVKTETAIQDGAAVSHATDPATVGPIATTVTDINEIHVYHPGSDLEIIPSSITLSGGAVSFEIPRCRMVKPELQDNPSAGLEYSTLTNFSQTVDVKRIYNTNNNPATLVYRKCQTRTDCTDTEKTACLCVRYPKIGSVAVEPDCLYTCGRLYKVKLNYYAGRRFVDDNGLLHPWARQAQDAIIRLAHAKMPHPACDCDAASEMWARDRNVIVDGFGRYQRGGMTPFGPQEGAWVAWEFAEDMKLRRGAVL